MLELGIKPKSAKFQSIPVTWGHLHVLTACSGCSCGEAAKSESGKAGAGQRCRVSSAGPGSPGGLWDAGSHPLLLPRELGSAQSSLSLGSSPWNSCPGLGWCRRRRMSDWRGWTVSGDRLPVPAALDLFLFIHCKSESILFIFILPCCDTLKIRGTFNFWFPFNTF